MIVMTFCCFNLIWPAVVTIFCGGVVADCRYCCLVVGIGIMKILFVYMGEVAVITVVVVIVVIVIVVVSESRFPTRWATVMRDGIVVFDRLMLFYCKHLVEQWHISRF